MTTIAVSLRSLARSPVLVLVTVLSLGVGIGATTTVFSIVNAFAFSPAIGLEDPASLVTVCAGRPEGDRPGPMSFPDYLQVGEAVAGLEEVVAFGFDAVSLGEGPDRTVELVQVVSGNFFPALGIRPVLGRGFLAEETPAGGASRVVVISHDLWRSRFAGDPDALGRTLRDTDVDGAPLVAVVNESFAERFFPGQNPLGRHFTARPPAGTGQSADLGPRTFEVVGLTRDAPYWDIDEGPHPYFWLSLWQEPPPIVTVLAKGRQSAEAMVPVLSREVEIGDSELTLLVPTTLSSQVELQLLPMQVGASLLGWGGVFGLFLAVLGVYGVVSFAVAARNREVAIRMAVGAERPAILRLFVRDGLVLALMGLGIGLALVAALAHLVRSLLIGMSPLDPIALGGAAAVILLAALAGSVVPASRATRLDPMGTLREG